MKKNLFFLGIVLIVAVFFFLPVVFADGLDFSDIDVDVDGETSDDVTAEGGSFEAAPGDSVEISVEVENSFPVNTSGHEIENIEMKIDVDSFCPRDFDDETEEEIKLDDLEPGIDDTATFRFTIPDCADEGNYDADIRVEGKDNDDDTEYIIEISLGIVIDKEPSAMTLEFSTPEPETIDCEERSFEIAVEAHNIGSIDEDSGLLIINDELGINKFEFLDLRTGKWTDEETYHLETYAFTINEDVPSGDYDIRAEIEYASNTKELKRYQTITVPECEIQDEEDEEQDEIQEELNAEEAIDTEESEEETTDTEESEEEAIEQTTTQTTTQTNAEDKISDIFTTPVLLIAIIVALIILFVMIVVLNKKYK